MLEHVELFAIKMQFKVLLQHRQIIHHQLKTSGCQACAATVNSLEMAAITMLITMTRSRQQAGQRMPLLGKQA